MTWEIQTLFTTQESYEKSSLQEMNEMLELRKKKTNRCVLKSWCGMQGKEYEL